MEDFVADGSIIESVKDGLHFGYQLHTVGNELEAFANNPARLEHDRTRFNGDVEIVSDDQADTVIEGENLRHMLGLPRKRPFEYDLKSAWQNSFPGRQFRHQVHDKLVMPGNGFLGILEENRERAEAMVREDWKEQGIWNEKWGIKPDGEDLTHRWMHEESPDFPSTSEVDTLPAPSLNMSSHLQSAKLRSSQPHHGIKSQEVAERPAKTKHNHDASRPFQQFIYQLSKEREEILGDAWRWPHVVVDYTDINTIAYEIVKCRWEKRLIWSEKWVTIPGMEWKHEKPFQKPEEVPSPEPQEVADDVARKCEPWLVGLDRDFVPADAESILPADQQRFPPDEVYTPPVETERILPAYAETPVAKRVQRTHKRKVKAADHEPRAPRRNVRRKSQSNAPKFWAENKKNGNGVDVHDREDRVDGRRRSKRLAKLSI